MYFLLILIPYFSINKLIIKYNKKSFIFNPKIRVIIIITLLPF